MSALLCQLSALLCRTLHWLLKCSLIQTAEDLGQGPERLDFTQVLHSLDSDLDGDIRMILISGWNA